MVVGFKGLMVTKMTCWPLISLEAQTFRETEKGHVIRSLEQMKKFRVNLGRKGGVYFIIIYKINILI